MIAPRYLSNKIDDSFDFNSEKVSKLRKQIDLDILNSKKELAKLLLVHIDQIETEFLVKQPTEESLTILFNQISDTQTVLLQSFKQTAEITLKDVTAKQAENFKKFSDEKFSEELELFKNKEKFFKKRNAAFVKTFEFFLDDLTAAQEKQISDFVDKNLNYFGDRILARQMFTTDFYQKLKLKEPTLEYFLNHYEGKKIENYSEDQKKYFMRLFEFETVFWKTVTEPQKKYFKKVLDSYRDELKEYI